MRVCACVRVCVRVRARMIGVMVGAMVYPTALSLPRQTCAQPVYNRVYLWITCVQPVDNLCITHVSRACIEGRLWICCGHAVYTLWTACVYPVDMLWITLWITCGKAVDMLWITGGWAVDNSREFTRCFPSLLKRQFRAPK